MGFVLYETLMYNIIKAIVLGSILEFQHKPVQEFNSILFAMLKNKDHMCSTQRNWIFSKYTTKCGCKQIIAAYKINL